MENWKKELNDIHSGIRVLLHSELAFPHKGETAGSMAERIIPHFKAFIESLISQAREEERKDVLININKIIEEQVNEITSKQAILDTLNELSTKETK